MYKVPVSVLEDSKKAIYELISIVSSTRIEYDKHRKVITKALKHIKLLENNYNV